MAVSGGFEPVLLNDSDTVVRDLADNGRVSGWTTFAYEYVANEWAHTTAVAHALQAIVSTFVVQVFGRASPEGVVVVRGAQVAVDEFATFPLGPR